MKNLEIRQLGPHDVLLGRGTGPNEAIGNIRLRDRIRAIIDEVCTITSDMRTKADLANVTIAEIKENGGKFLKKIILGSENASAACSSFQSVYEEVCDSVAFSKVKQCIRHQLVRTLCPRTTRRPKRNRVVPPSKKNQASLPWPVEAISPTNMPQNNSSSFSPRSPASISGTLVHPSEKPHHHRKLMSEDRCCAIQADILHQQHLQSLADSELQSRVFDTRVAEILARNIRHQNHIASSTADPMLARPPPPTNNERDVILQLVRQQERVLLQHAMATRRNKESPLELDLCSPATQERVLASKLVMLGALRAQELGSRCLRWSSDGGAFHYRSSPVASHFF